MKHFFNYIISLKKNIFIFCISWIMYYLIKSHHRFHKKSAFFFDADFGFFAIDDSFNEIFKF
jgi:hypothetical protein